MDLDGIINSFKKGDVRALSRLITYVENGWEIDRIFKELYRYSGKAYRIGITGPPGAGKSTLVDKLAVALKDEGFNPAVIAVDPSSPFTGGAVLGDRLRMIKAMEKGVFIRSMASRGSLGGLAEATDAVADLMDAFGFDVIIIETVGVGQLEVDIVRAADTVVVVLVPESGDAIQALKAGLMEIAHVFVVNKADRAGADRFIREMETVISLSNQPWKPPIIKTVALKGEGIDRLVESILKHREHILPNREALRVSRVKSQVEKILVSHLIDTVHERGLHEKVRVGLQRKKTPYDIAYEIEKELYEDKLNSTAERQEYGNRSTV